MGDCVVRSSPRGCHHCEGCGVTDCFNAGFETCANATTFTLQLEAGVYDLGGRPASVVDYCVDSAQCAKFRRNFTTEHKSAFVPRPRRAGQRIVISGAGMSESFITSEGQMFVFDSPLGTGIQHSVCLQNITVSGAALGAGWFGGALSTYGYGTLASLQFDRVRFADNVAPLGGAARILNVPDIRISRCIFRNNAAVSLTLSGGGALLIVMNLNVRSSCNIHKFV